MAVIGMDEARHLVAAGRYSEAEAAYRTLVAEQPFEALHNLGFVYRNTGQLIDAERCYRDALSLRPDAPSTRFALAILLLSQGRYAEGWPLYESRAQHLRLYEPQTAAKPWRGEDLTGRHLLVLGEQGLGDQIQFLRFVRQAPAARITFWAQPPLCRLFLTNGFNVAPGVPQLALPDADYWVRVMSLPLWLGADVNASPYLSAKPRAVGGVGLMTRGDPRHANDANRSIPPELATWLFDQHQFVDLSPVATGARDMLDTAEIIAGLDLVVTVDTSIAHLAGAMGKPVWIILPAAGTDWRWMVGRSSSPWYASARLYRQPEPGDWNSVLNAVLDELSTSG